ncbi:MAG: stage III sporulation protein AE [Acetivibrio ethanolgignens]
MGKWKILWLVGFLCLGGLINPLKATAQENPAGIEGLEAWDLDYGEAERVLKEELELNSFDLGNYIQKIFSGEESFSLDSIWGYLKEGLVKEFEKDRNQLLRVVVIAVAAAVFTNFSNVFKSNQVADTGFYVAYLLMFSVLAASFFEISKTASLVLESLADFMKALAPAFFTTVTMASGAGTSLLFYQIALVVIWLVEMVLLKLILPLIHIYFVLHLLNHLMEKDVLSKTTQILEEGVNWSLKAMLGLVAGYNFIQGIMLPAADELKRSGLMRAATAIPGVGNAIGSVAETVLGAGVLVKNAVGAGGIMALLLLMSGPVGKLFCYMLFYRLGAALVQPVSDKRILECMSGASVAAKLLLLTVCTGGALFLLTIAIVMSATNLRL